jgi:hypothetical protein
VSIAEHASAGGKARQAKARKQIAERAELQAVMTPIVENLGREQIGPTFLRHAHTLAERATTAEVDVNTAGDVRHLAEAANILHKMARLELGESTSNSMTFNVSDIAAKRAELEARLAALDVSDTTPPD